MPKFETKQEKSVEVAKATFEKASDYKVVTLVKDPQKKQRVLHKIQAERLIKAKKAVEVKDVDLTEREVETVVTVEKKVKK